MAKSSHSVCFTIASLVVASEAKTSQNSNFQNSTKTISPPVDASPLQSEISWRGGFGPCNALNPSIASIYSSDHWCWFWSYREII